MRRAAIVAVTCVVIGSPVVWAAKNKKKPAPGSPPVDAPSTVTPELPSDPNSASLRVGAMQALYELDASAEQLRGLRQAADGSADTTARAPAKASPKLTAALVGLRDALVSGGDDKAIAEARNAFADASAEADVQLDDAVHPAPAVRLKAAALCRSFSAGQLAAYLASHADEVVGPVDRLVAAVGDMHDDPPEEADAEIRQVSTDVGLLVAGSDDAKATTVAGRAADWLRANRNAATDSVEAREKLVLSAKGTVGDVPPVEVLGHWFEDEVAQLLANPQFPEAAAAMLAVREKESH